MSAQYTRDHCKIAVAKILQTLGWHSINSTPIEVLTDILSEYIKQIVKHTNDYATEFGHTEANFDHLGLAFQELGINLHELQEYVTYVNFAPPPHPVPKYPIPKENNLNFLKPGSKEVVTRPVHVHEYLPPMYPLMEGSDAEAENTVIKKENEESTENPQFRKPVDVFSPEFKRQRREDEGSRPTRKISSVIMTTSGFLSPAREGKLPEAKAPAPPPEPVRPPSPEPIIVKKKPEKKKDKAAKELFKPIQEEKVLKKTPTIVKDVFKMKQQKPSPNPPNVIPPQLMHNAPPLHPLSTNDIKISPAAPGRAHLSPKANFSKALAAAKAKTERLNTTITPIPVRPDMSQFQPSPHVDKLFTEPDKQKVNIFKKISTVREKHEHKQARRHTNQHFIDDPLPSDIVSKINLSSDITIEPIMNPMMWSNPDRMEMNFFDNSSPPVTPPTPRTPEFIPHHTPPILKRERKRKDKTKVKKLKKQPPPFMEPEVIDMTMDRPKTPDAHVLMRHQYPPQFPVPPMAHQQMPYFPLSGYRGPGLIPPPLSPHLFPFAHLPTLPNFGKNPYFATMPPMEQVPRASPKIKEVKEVPKQVPKPEPEVVVPSQPEPRPLTPAPAPPQIVEEPVNIVPVEEPPNKKSKEHKKEKKDKVKKKNKKEKVKDKGEKKKLKEGKKEKIKKEKKIKKKVIKDIKEVENPIPKILLKVNSPSPRPETPETLKKLNIKPIVRKDDELPLPPPEEKKRDPSPGLAKISALVTGPPKQKTVSPVSHAAEKPAADASVVASAPRPPGRPRIHPVKPKPSPPKPKKVVELPFVKKDEQGNEVWICPACGQQDDGRPMIGCDGCDAWYHWVCVGIQVPPDENENWYCKPCLCKKNEDLQDKKKKRKKKEKKDH